MGRASGKSEGPWGQPLLLLPPDVATVHAGLKPQAWTVALCYLYYSCLNGEQQKLSLRSKWWEALQLGKSSLDPSYHHCSAGRLGVGRRYLPIFSQAATAAKVAKPFRWLLDQQTFFFFPLSLQD